MGVQIRGEEILLPVSAVSAFPRPHWLQGRVFGSQYEPTYRSHNLRVAYEDASKLVAREQERAGLHILCDGVQYYEVVARHSGKCLDKVWTWNVVQYNCHAGDNQLWTRPAFA